MNGKAALLLVLGGVVAGVLLVSACGGDGEQAGATGNTVAATPTITSAVSPEMLKNMVPGAADVPGFVISDARFLDNAGASAQAPDPAARQASLDKMGRIVGFHTIFNQLSKAPPGAPTALLWSVNLFQQPSGALAFVSQQPDAPEGSTYEAMDVSTLGPNAVGSAYRSSVGDKAASQFSVAFADGVIQVTLTALYEDDKAPPDYTLNLAQRARTLVETALGSQPAQPSPQAEGAAPGPPTATPAAPVVPQQAGGAAPAMPTATPMGMMTAATHACLGVDCP